MTTLNPSHRFAPTFRRKLSRLVCLSVVGLALGAGTGVTTSAHAAKKSRAKAQQASMSCELWAVWASKGKAKQRIPGNLAPLSPELSDDQFAAFSSFRLLEKKQMKVQSNTPRTQSFSAGYQMQLNLVQRAKDRLKVHVNLRRNGAANLVNLDYWMNSGSLLMLVGGNYKDGKIVFATRCRANN